MSTVSGVFPNAITPTFAASNDPAATTRQRRENETIVFSPIEELEQNSQTRSSQIEQPGRLEAEYNVQATAQGLGGETHASADMADTAVHELQGSSSERSAAGSSSDEMTEREQIELDAELELISELAARDREVRMHEQAHQAVGGQYAGAMEFTYTTGPDGVRYATSGEVSISVSEISDDPEATLDKAQTIQAAALAPAEPSAQDRRVAALAAQMAVEAQSEIRQQASESSEVESEDRTEQDGLASDSEEVIAQSRETEEEQESLAEQNEERLDAFMAQTQQTVRAALNAAYQAKRPDDISAYLIDTSV
jgi:hypothetical protein